MQKSLKSKITVKQLIGLLQECRQEAIVVLGKDHDGDVFSPIHKLVDDENIVFAEEYELGELAVRDACPDGQPAIFLFPA